MKIGDLGSRASAVSWRAGHWMMRNVVGRAPFAEQAWRVFDVLQHEGLGGIVRRVAFKAQGNSSRGRATARIREISRGRVPIVLAPTVEWDITLFQRPQQIALALGRLGWPVLYATSNQAVGRDGVRAVAENVYLVDNIEACLQLPRFALVVFSTSPRQVSLERLDQIGERAIVIYDFLDEQHDDVYDLDPSMRNRHIRLMAEADIVSVTADRLREQVAEVRKRPVLYCPNAADLPHFRPNGRRTAPADVQRVLQRGQPIIAYYGALASWFDYELVRRVANERPEYQIVLIGVDYDRSLERSGLEKLTNVNVLGPKRYADLPSYLDHFDVMIIPFLLNDVTESTSPIKLFEYMAAEKPIVTTDLRECRKYRSVLIGKDPAHFIAQLDHALTLRQDSAHRALLAADAAENSWARRASDLGAEIEREATVRVWTKVR